MPQINITCTTTPCGTTTTNISVDHPDTVAAPAPAPSPSITAVTQSTPEAASAPEPMCNGRIIVGQHFHFKSQADRDTFNAALVQITALTNAKGGKSFAYNMDTAPTELTIVWVWDCAASFQVTEKLFGETEAITAMVGTFTCEAYFSGDISAETRGLIAKWNEAPGFDIHCCENEVAYADSSWNGMPHDAMGAFGVFEHASEADRDAYLAEGKKTAAVWISRTHVLSHAKVVGSPTKSVHIWFLKSKADTLGFLNEELPSKIMEDMIAMIPGMVSFGGTCFGNTNDAEIKAGLAPWTTWPAAPLISGSLGGKSFMFLQKAVFTDTAARDATANALKASAIGGDHEGAYFGCPLGDSQMWMVHMAKDTAGNKAVQGGFVADPALMAAYTGGGITHLPTYNAGNVQNEWMNDFAGWEEGISALYASAAPLVIHREGGSFGPDAFTIVQEIVFNDAAGYETFIDVQMDPAIRNDPIQHCFSMWKTSSKTCTGIYCFASSDEWMACNKNFTPHAEALGKAIEKVTCYMAGPISDEAKAGIDGWAAAPWTDMQVLERVGKMGGGAKFGSSVGCVSCGTTIFQAALQEEGHCWDDKAASVFRPDSWDAVQLQDEFSINMSQGQGTCAHVNCGNCNAKVGWKFVHSPIPSQTGCVGLMLPDVTINAISSSSPPPEPTA